MNDEITPAMMRAGAAAAFDGPWPDNVAPIYLAMRAAAPRQAILLEMAAAGDEAQAREKDWLAVCSGAATLDQFIAAVTYAACCAGWDGTPYLPTPSQRLDAATVERCAQLVDQAKFVVELRGIEVGDEAKAASFGRMLTALAKDVRALATDPHQHGGKGA